MSIIRISPGILLVLALLPACQTSSSRRPGPVAPGVNNESGTPSPILPNSTGSLPSQHAAPSVTQQGPAGTMIAKKGAAMWSFGAASTALADVNAGWYYTWRATNEGITAPPGIPFVPMIWGPRYANSTEIAAAKAGGDTLLGFNEPDHTDQSNMSVQQALSLWPMLMATGQRLGSPATAADPSPSGSWQEQFMAGAKAAGYRIDFLCVHWYGDGTDPTVMTAKLQAFLQSAYAKYQLPIWLTEYSLINFNGARASPQQEAAFATASMAMLDALPFVERYSWYAMPPQGSFSLYDNSGRPTVVGAAYRLPR